MNNYNASNMTVSWMFDRSSYHKLDVYCYSYIINAKQWYLIHAKIEKNNFQM